MASFGLLLLDLLQRLKRKSLTFQRLDDLQAVGQVGPGSSRGAAGVSRAAVGVVGAGGGGQAGGQAVVGGEEAAGALALVARG